MPNISSRILDGNVKLERETKDARSRVSYILAISALAVMLGACNNDSNSNNNEQPCVGDDCPCEGDDCPKTCEGDDCVVTEPKLKIEDSETTPVTLSSTAGCRIDTDCVDGMFCFQGTCSSECDAQRTCKTGSCNDRGRCVMANDKQKHDLSTPDAVADTVIPDAHIVLKPMSTIDVLAGAETVTTRISTTTDYGPIMYRVESEGRVVADAATAEAQLMEGANQTDPVYTYTFTIPTDESALGSKGKVESVTLVSSVGTFNLDLVPHPEASGAYDGAVVARQFGGSSIPFRAAVDVTPKNPASFDDIKSIKLYLPVSQKDIYSPESVELGKVHWAWVNMQKTEDDDNCHVKGHPCFEASFGANDYIIDGSQVVNEATKLYRSIRVELSDYDANANRFEGFVSDGFQGIYRQKGDTDDSFVQWAEVTVEGNLLMVRTSDDDWNNPNKDVREHKREISINRPVNESISLRCSNADLVSIFKDTECEVNSLNDYNQLSDEDKIQCAVNGANKLLESDKLTSKTITTFLESQDTTELVTKTGCASFGEFLTACSEQTSCAAGDEVFCKERTDFVCAVDILSSLYFDKTAILNNPNSELNSGVDKLYGEVVFSDILQLMRESYLGPQFAAYQNDINIRKKWLENVDAPSIASSVLEQFNSSLLKTWKEQVLNAHFGVISKQFSQGVIEAIARGTNNEAIKSLRGSVLNEYGDAWMGASEALALATRRYDSLLTSTAERLEEAANIRPNLIDLYIVGAVESRINLNNDATSINASFGPGLNEIINGIKSLDQSFEDLVYMRDAEIAVSHSLDPQNTNSNLLQRRKQAAIDALDAAESKKTYVFDKITAQQFNEKSIAAVLSANVNSLKAEMANLCGLPDGCDSVDKCEVEVETFKCGFKINKELDDAPTLVDGSANIGTAGAAILAYREADLDVKIAMADLDAQIIKHNEAQSAANSFAKTIEQLNKDRNDTLASIQNNLNKLKELVKDNAALEIDKLEINLNAMKDELTSAQEDLETWDKMVSADNENTKSLMDDIAKYSNQALDSEFAGDVVQNTADVAAEFMSWDWDWDDEKSSPSVVSAMNAGNAAVRGAIKTAGLIGWSVAYSMKNSYEQKVNNAQRDIDEAELANSYKLEKWEREGEVDSLQARIDVQTAINNIEKTIINNSADMELLKITNESLQKAFDAKEQYLYDREELEQLRATIAGLKADIATKRAIVTKTEIARDKKVIEYLSIAQNAQMLKSQYDAAQQRFADVKNVYSTPSCVFSYASDLETVETNIERAKEKIYDYLALVEYYAVRPFVDLRRAIYLAKAPNDLRKIINKINDLVDECGSTAQQNKPEITISLREFMGITRDYSDMTMPERFRAVMRYSDLPVDSLTRYTAEKDVKALFAQNNLMAGTFQIDKDTFNIGANCNAKINEISVRIEGDNLTKPDDGAVYPFVTIFYNGSASLTSCQPHMDDVVAPLGGRTKFGTQTFFSIPTEKASPIASIGKYKKIDAETKFTNDDFGNIDTAFDGLPIMTSYTVLIDPEMKANAKINWDNIEDIKLKIKYSYDKLKNSACY